VNMVGLVEQPISNIRINEGKESVSVQETKSRNIQHRK